MGMGFLFWEERCAAQSRCPREALDQAASTAPLLERLPRCLSPLPCSALGSAYLLADARLFRRVASGGPLP